jgi:hypothetical protein
VQTSTIAPEPVAADEAWPVIWRRTDVVLGFGGLLLGLLVVIGYLVAAVDLEEAETSIAAAWATLAFEIWIGLIVVLLARARGLSFRDLGYVAPRRWGLVAVAVIGAYVSIVAYFAVLLLLESFGVDLDFLRRGNAIPTSDEDTLGLYIVLGLSIVVAAPLGEELFFRGLLFRGFMGDGTGTRQRVAALWLSGLAFSLFHLNLAVLIPFALVGALFAYAFRGSRSLWTSTAAHAIFNGINFAATMLDRA